MEAVFSADGQYLATSVGEQLKIWEVASNSLFQEFSAGGKISCVSWSQVSGERCGVDVCVSAGVGEQVVVWRLCQGQRTAVLEGEHFGQVKCLAWSSGCGIGGGNGTVGGVFSGGEDGHIVHWDSDTGQSVKKWKAFRSSVHSLCCHGGGLLLSAGRMVKVWQVADYSLVKKLSGHSSSVSHLVAIGEDYFLSAARDDRVINVWCSSSSDRDAVCSLVSEESVVGVVCSATPPLMNVAVLCGEGKLQLFQVSMDKITDKSAAAISPSSTLQYVSTADQVSTPSTLPVFSLVFSKELLLHLAYGSVVRPVMDSLIFDVSQKHQCLVREVSQSGLLLRPTGGKHQDQGRVPAVTVLAPGNMAATLHQSDVTADHRPLTERLEQHSDSKPLGLALGDRRPSHPPPPPSTESLSQLLAQSVTSGDGKLLEEVLRVTKEKVVSATVKKLPVNLVLPFMKKLIQLLRQSPARGLELSIWIKTLLSCHAAYLMTVPELSSSVSGLYEVLEARVATFTKLCALQGKLNFLIAHAAVEDGVVSAAQVALSTPTVTITLGESYPAEEDIGGGTVEVWREDMESESEADSETSMDG